jgi:hypothetical protein
MLATALSLFPQRQSKISHCVQFEEMGQVSWKNLPIIRRLPIRYQRGKEYRET